MVKNLKAIKNKFLEVVSLSNRKYRSITFSFVLGILFAVPVKNIEWLPNLSLCKAILGDYCPSVGITRGVSSLLKGNIRLAIEYNWLSIPVLIVMISILFYDLYKLNKN